MNELKRIAADIESAFDASGYPREFLAAFDQLECLASHAGRETFLVQPKGDGALAVATCYDRTVLPFRHKLVTVLHLVQEMLGIDGVLGAAQGYDLELRHSAGPRVPHR